MRESTIAPSGVERTFGDDEIIVSKTDPKGILTYVNDVFVRISAYPENELIGRPHNVIRHPDMPRSVFKLLWDTLGAGEEMFAYIVNLSADGAHYWVLAHVTPSRDSSGRTVGFHSNRRTASKAALDRVEPLYAELLEVERRAGSTPAALTESAALLAGKLADMGLTYAEFVWSLDDADHAHHAA